jgi:inner membrane protein
LASIAAVFPDLDLLIPYRGGPIEKQALHRFFTHTLLLLPFEALLLSWAFRYLLRNETLDKVQRYALALLGLLSHVFLDFLTSGGLPFLWPLTTHRFALDILPIVDPLFSFLLFFLFFSLWRDKSVGKWVSGSLALAYGILAGIQHERALECQQALWQQRHHMAQRAYILPSPGNILLWRSIYAYKGDYYVDGFRLGSAPTFYTGHRAPRITLEEMAPQQGTEFYKACSLFFWIGRDCIARLAPGVYANLCYSFLPHTSTLVAMMVVQEESIGITGKSIRMLIPQNWRERLQKEGRLFWEMLWNGEGKSIKHK